MFCEQSCTGSRLGFVAVKADNEMITGAGGSHVQQPEALVLGHLFIDGGPCVIAGGCHTGRES